MVITPLAVGHVLTHWQVKEVRYNAVPPVVYRSFGFPGAEDLGNTLQFNREINEYYCGAGDPGVARAPNPALLTFDA